MNLAFPALCILLLVLPGIIFRKAYTRGSLPIFFPPGRDHEKSLSKYPTSVRPFNEEIVVSLIAAILLHVFWLSVCTGLHTISGWFGMDLFEVKPDYQKVIYVLYGAIPSSTVYISTLDYLADQHIPITLYFLSLYLISFFLARTSLWIVRYYHLDHQWMTLRLEDQWFYFLRGEIFQFSEFKQFIGEESSHSVSGTYVSIVVAQGKTDYLYKGFLWDFYLNRDGNLDRLLLHNVIRCPFDSNTNSEKSSESVSKETEKNDIAIATESLHKAKIEDHLWTFQRVSSQVFTVRYADCKTLACTYFYIEEPLSEPDDSTIKIA